MEEGTDAVLLDGVDVENHILVSEQENPIEQLIEKLNQLGDLLDLLGLGFGKAPHNKGRVEKEEV